MRVIVLMYVLLLLYIIVRLRWDDIGRCAKSGYLQQPPPDLNAALPAR